MEVPAQTSEVDAWDEVLRQTMLALEANADPYAWAFDVSLTLRSSAIAIPSIELAHRLVSLFFWDNHSAAAWKLLRTALSLDMIPGSLLIALLSAKVVPSRKLYPTAYRLYMELLKQLRDMLEHDVSSPNYEKKHKSAQVVSRTFFSFSFSGYGKVRCLFLKTNNYISNRWFFRIMKSIDDDLQLSQVYSQKLWEPGVVLVEFVFSIVWQLLEASLDDEGLLDHTTENKPIWLCRSHDMNIDEPDSLGEEDTEQVEGCQKKNTAIAIEIILLVSNASLFENLRNNAAETLLSLTQNIHEVVSHEFKRKSKMRSNEFISAGSLMSFAGQSYGDSWSSLWLPIDLILEDALDGGQVAAFSAIEIITGEKDSKESPISRLDTCMCMLLSITTLVVTCIIDEEEGQLIEEAEHSHTTNKGTDKQALGKCRGELITSLQLLGDYESLLTPPQPVLAEANEAAAKAILFLSGNPVSSGYLEYMTTNGLQMKSGNLRHLIVEACIAKNLLDTSAYLWPGYVNACSNQIPCSISNHVSGWSSLMEGSQLTPALVNVLIATPASSSYAPSFGFRKNMRKVATEFMVFDGSLEELEKIYEIAINGSDEEKISAATILCGASLVRGWNVQELTVLFITKLLSRIDPPNYSGADSHLTSQAAFLNVLLMGISSVDCVHIFSLHGLVPLLAAGLMLICEVFGSLVPDAMGTLATGENLTHWEVFSNAFTLLLRFWRFDHLPVERVRSGATTPPFGSLLSPDCLLLVRNSKLASLGRTAEDRQRLKRWSNILSFPVEPVFMDSFPKLNFWYRKHQECIASTRSGLVLGRPVHQIVDALLSMMFRKVSYGAEPLTPTTSGSSISSGLAMDDALMKLKVPAWDTLEAIPFALDAALTSCAYGKLTTRELATGLKDLVDFLPASLVTIASYFSAEVTRGIWKPALMNETDWPSPAANLPLVEQQIKKILADVDVPSLDIDGNSPATLPLPLAAFVTLTITDKLDNATERFLALIAPAVSALASACPWPSLPIVTSLWIQKVKRWSNYFVLSASSTVFRHNRDAVVQLLKSCFTSTLGLGSACIYNNGGISALLGHGFVSRISDGIFPVAPGILYLRVYRSIGDITLLIEEIVPILMLSVRDIARSDLAKGGIRKPKKTKFGIKHGQVSLARSMARVEHAALLGASLVWISGGTKLVQYLISETLPSWFLSASMLDQGGGESGVMVAKLEGYALAFFVFLSAAFAWGIDNLHPPKRRAKVIGLHLKFLETALNRTTSMRCYSATSEAYVSGLVSLMVGRAPSWVQEADVDLLKRLSRRLRRMDEHELAIRLLEIGGIRMMGALAEMIIEFNRI
ncbi:unnamed protein product [Sphenostylis stenocarpa]|uniref:Mediator of RNA polymerase II transcription subunit 33A n=1 Tax=Sphenostylis stenocarpa TaxID=92480 RepID=A0AA86VWB6_9FABA|nr:unnamed protein product [Sphenostylis stenocarpa]